MRRISTGREFAVQAVALILAMGAGPGAALAGSATEEPSAGPQDAAGGDSFDLLIAGDDRAAQSEESLETIPVGTGEPSAPPDIEPRKTPHRQIEEIIVTATKRSESLRDIPASIAHFSGEDLERQGKVDMSDFIKDSPGVSINNAAPGVARVSIRGIGVDNSPGATLSSPVGFFIGDTSFTDPYINGVTPDLSAFDLASVEVLKGPQGAVFGGSALSGAIRYVLQQPSFNELEGKLFSQYTHLEHGSHAYTWGAVVNVPLIDDTLAARFVYVKRNYPGLFDNSRSGEKDVNDGGGEQYRALLRWQPTDRLGVTLTYLYQDYAADDAIFLADNRHERSWQYSLVPSPTNNDFSMGTLEVRYDFDRFSVFSLTSLVDKFQYIYADISLTFFTPPPGAPPESGLFQAYSNASDSVSQEIRLQSNGDWWLDWMVGAYWFDYNLLFEIDVNTVAQDRLNDLLSSIGLDPTTVGRETSLLYGVNDAVVTEKAVFFDLKKTVWDRLDLAVGARLYQTEVIGGYDMVGTLARLANNGQDVSIKEKIPESGISPRLSAKFNISNDISTYVQAARGFRFGGVQTIPANEREGIPPVYKSDSLWSYEWGVRTAWLDYTLQFDAAAFLIDYTDPQVLQQSQTSNLAYKDNVGSARSTGIEASLTWLTPLEGLSLALNGSLLDARTTEAFTDSSGNEIPSGTQMPGAVDAQYAATIGYSGEWSRLGTYNSYLNYSYVGKSFGDLAQTAAVNDYGTLNAGISFAVREWRLRPQIALNVANILDVTRPIGGGVRTTANGDVQELYTINAPRTVNVRVSIDF